MIITVGALFLLDQNSFMGFDRTWPVILLVAGLFLFLSRSASAEGHVQPYGAMPMPMPMTAPMPQTGAAQAGMPAQPATTNSQANQQEPTHTTNDDSQVNS
jgi:hypothetical protein